MVDALPPSLAQAALAHLPADDILYGAVRRASRYWRDCCLAYMATVSELVVRPGIWVQGAVAARRRLRTLIVETAGPSAAVDAALGAVLPLSNVSRIVFRSGSVSLSTLRLLLEGRWFDRRRRRRRRRLTPFPIAGCPMTATMTMADCDPTDRHLELVAGFRHLQVLDLSGSWRLTDLGVGHLSRGCSNLQILDLSGCVRISDRALETLTDHCPLRRSPRSAGQRAFQRLQSLDLSETDVSESGIELVRERCPHIENLIVNDCFRSGLYAAVHQAFEANTIAWHQAA